MKLQCTIYVPPKNRVEYGFINITETGIDLAKKNKFFALGFGALGAVLTPAKVFTKISWHQVSNIEMRKFGMSKKTVFVILNDGSEYIFRLPKPDQSITLLEEPFNKSKTSIMSEDNLFKD